MATCAEHADHVHAAAYAPDGRTVASIGSDRTLRMWAVSGRQPLARLEKPADIGHPNGAVYSRDGRHLVVWGNKDAILWDLANHRYFRSLRPASHDVASAAFSSDGRMLAVACRTGVTRLWETESGRHLRDLTGHEGWHGVHFSGENDTLIALGINGTISAWDTARGRTTGPSQLGESANYLSLSRAVVSPRGATLIWPGDDNNVHRFSLEKRRLLPPLTGHTSDVECVAFSDDGKRIASGAGNLLRLWDATTCQTVQTFRHTGGVQQVAFALGAQRLVSSSYDRKVWIWDVDSPNPLRVLPGHPNGAFRLAVSPDGRWIVSVASVYKKNHPDATSDLYVWDASTGYLIGVLPGTNRFVSALAFSPDGSMIVSGGENSVELWSRPVPLDVGPYLKLCELDGLDVRWAVAANSLKEERSLGWVNQPLASHLEILQAPLSESEKRKQLFDLFLRAGNLSSAAVMATQIAEADQRVSALDRLIDEFSAIETNNPERIVPICDRELGTRPNCAHLLIARGCALLRLSEARRGYADLEKAAGVPLASQRCLIHLARGYSRSAQAFQFEHDPPLSVDQCLDRAISCLSQALAEHPGVGARQDLLHADYDPIRSLPRYRELADSLTHNREE